MAGRREARQRWGPRARPRVASLQFSRSGARTPHAVLARASRRYPQRDRSLLYRTAAVVGAHTHSFPVVALLTTTPISLVSLKYVVTARGFRVRCCLTTP